MDQSDVARTIPTTTTTTATTTPTPTSRNTTSRVASIAPASGYESASAATMSNATEPTVTTKRWTSESNAITAVTETSLQRFLADVPGGNDHFG